MKYFLDTEFIEKPNHLDLISIGIVAEDGRELYYENTDCDWSQASPWVMENVFPHLDFGPLRQMPQNAAVTRTRYGIAEGIKYFVKDDPAPEFWGYYADYDWVALCWLYGRMIDLPKGFPYFCRDLRQALNDRGLQHIKQPDDAAHHALNDARWIKAAYAEHIGFQKAVAE